VTDSLVWLDGHLSGQGTLIIEEGAVFRIVGGDDLHLPLSYQDLVVRGELSMEPGIDLEIAYTDLVVASTGRWELGRGGRIRNAALHTPSIDIQGILAKSDAETTLVELPLICSGELVLEGGVLSVTDSFELTASGLIRGGRRDGQPGGATRLDLTRAGICVLAGTIEPDHGGDPAWLGIDGTVAMRPTTVVRIDLAESGGIRGERLVLPGASAMGGTLVIDRRLDPLPGEMFTVVATGMGTGAFGEIVGADGFVVNQDQDGVRLTWPDQLR
jgi:hypothetical protein